MRGPQFCQPAVAAGCHRRRWLTGDATSHAAAGVLCEYRSHGLTLASALIMQTPREIAERIISPWHELHCQQYRTGVADKAARRAVQPARHATTQRAIKGKLPNRTLNSLLDFLFTAGAVRLAACFVWGPCQSGWTSITVPRRVSLSAGLPPWTTVPSAPQIERTRGGAGLVRAGS